MANPEHVEIVKQGAEAIAAWREANPGEWLDLAESNLQNTILEGANLQSANLQNTQLLNSMLYSADLKGADLLGAYLNEVLDRICRIIAAYAGPRAFEKLDQLAFKYAPIRAAFGLDVCGGLC